MEQKEILEEKKNLIWYCRKQKRDKRVRGYLWSKKETKEILITEFIKTDDYNFEEILDTLNLEWEKYGVQFKRGKTHDYGYGEFKYMSIVCKHKNLHQSQK